MRNLIRVALLSATTILTLVAPAGAGTTAGNVRVAIDSAVSSSTFGSVGRDSVVILQSWQGALANSIKSSHPGVKVLMYKNLSSMATRDQWGNLATGVSTQDAATRADWYLLNTSGSRFTFNSYGTLWAADIGSATFQQTWADNVIADLKKASWDGVFMDDTNPTMSGHYTASLVAKYPTDAAYTAATRSALAAISPRLHGAGELVVPNVGALHSFPGVLTDWLQFVDGVMEEHFTKWETPAGTGYMTGTDWKVALDEAKTVAAAGKMLLGVARSDVGDAVAARYGFATMLLGSNGLGNFAMHNNYSTENWIPEYDADLGAPGGPEQTLSSGVHSRAFANGLVLVNPTTSTITVPLSAAYSGSGLTAAISAPMAPHTGMVLIRDIAPVSAQVDPVAALPPIDPVGSPTLVDPVSAPSPAPDAAPAPTAIAPAPASGDKHTVKVTCHGQRPCTARVSLRKGKLAMAATAVSLRAGRSRTLSFRVASRGPKARTRVTVIVTALGPGRAVASPRTLTL